MLWQLFWAWIVAPVILWRARRIRDTQGWRLQTIACCLSKYVYREGFFRCKSLTCLAFTRPQCGSSRCMSRAWPRSTSIGFLLNGMSTPTSNLGLVVQPLTDRRLALSIMAIEIFTIFIPCWEVFKHQALAHETLESIAKWEARQKSSKSNGAKSLNSASTSSSWMPRSNRASSMHSEGSSVLTMDALEHTLAKNPEPLQEFSALRDFSGENIAFLTRVREWRLTHFPATKEYMKNQATEIIVSREAFESALHIYLDFISASAAEFQVNLSSSDFKSLEAVFENAARIMYGERRTPDPATPFDDFPTTPPPGIITVTNGSETAIVADVDGSSEDDTLDIHYWGEIPAAFDENVFSDAESSIKYLVLTNTWPKFIKDRRSFDTERTLEDGK